MSAIIGALRGVLSLDSAAFDTGVDRSIAKMGGLERRLTQSGTKLQSLGKRLTLGLTVPIAAIGAAAVKSSMSAIDAQAKLAQSLGTTVKSVQVLERAGDLAGVSMEGVAVGVKDMTRRLSQAVTFGGPVAKALNSIHLNAAQLMALPVDQRVQKINEALETFAPAATRAAIAGQIFGEEGSLAITRIDTETLRTAIEDIERFGVAVSEADADQIEKTNDAISRMGLAARGVGNQLAVAVAPVLETIADGVAHVAGWFNQLGSSTQLTIGILGGFAVAAGPVAAGLGLMASWSAPVIRGLLTMGPAMIASARSAIALEMALGATSSMSAVAGVAVKGFSRALTVLKGALISTGIGAVVVVAGVLVNWFSKLVTSTGGWGNALTLLGDVAKGVWDGIKGSAKAIAPALHAIWESVKASFFGLLSSLTEEWSRFLGRLSRSLAGVRGLEGVSETLGNASADIISVMSAFDAKAQSASSEAGRLGEEAKRLASEGFEAARAAAKKLSDAVQDVTDESGDGTAATDALKDALKNIPTIGGKAGKSLKGLADVAKAFTKAMKDAAFTAEEFGQEKARILISGIDTVSNAWGDWIAGGLKDFGGFVDSVLGSFKTMFAQMVALAARNQIMISLGFGGVAAGTPAAAAGSAGSSILGIGNLLGAAGGSLLSGAFTSVGALFSGGVSSMFSTIGGQFATAFASGTASSIAASIGSVLGPIALFGVALTAIIGTVRTLDAGIQVTVNEMDTLVETYRVRRRSYLFGLINSTSTGLSRADAAVADPIIDAVAQIQASVLNMSDILGIGAEAFDGFSTVVRISTMDMTDEEIAAEVQAQLTAVADAMAEMALEGFEMFRSGESASEALARLSSSLVAVTQVSELLGHSFTGTGVLGAALASSLVDAFGGLDAYTSATRSYFEAFFSEEERRAAILSQTTAALAQINVVMPTTRQQYRDMIAALDLTTERGRELYATLIGMADVMDFVLPSVQGFTDIISALVGSTGSVVDQMLSEGASMARAAETAASNWYKASETIKGLISDILNANTTGPAGRDQALRYNLSQYEAALSAARGGDLEAARSIPSLASAYLESVKGTASSFAEFQAAQARILGDARFLSGIAELEGANQDVLVTLYQEQIGILEEVRDYLATTETINADDISSFEARLGSLQAAIEEAELFSYDYLRERLQVTVDLLPTANLPEDVRALIRAATTGIESSINFAVYAADLTPDLRWLAVNGASEHIKTIEFVVGDSQWSQAAQDVALGSAGTFVQTVQFVARNLMSAEMTEIALTDASALIKTIRFSAQAIPADLRALIFNDIEALDKTINFLEGDSLPDDKQALALEDASTFRRIINIVAGNITGERIQQLALDDPLAFRRVINITAGTIPDISVRRLALDAAAEFTRIINLEPGATLDANTVRLALMTSGSVTRTIRAVMSNGLTHDEMLLALAGSSELARVVNVSLASGSDPVAIQLALGNIGAYAVNIRAALQASAEVREIVFGDAGSYAAMIEAAFSADLSDEARRVLLEQQGEYAVNIIATLSADIPDNVRTLLLNANTSAIRGITIATAFAGSVDPDELPLLLEDSTAVLRMISIAVNPIGITAFDMLFMDVLASGQAETWRGIRAGVDTSGIAGRSLTYLTELGSDAFWRWRGLRGGVDLSRFSNAEWAYFTELESDAWWRWRGIRGGIDAGAAMSTAYWQELRQGAAWRQRGLTGGIDTSAVTGTPYWAELRNNQYWRWRGITAGIDTSQITGTASAFFSELRTGSYERWRRIRGEVLTGAITGTGLTFFDELVTGTSTRWRGLTAGIDTSALLSGTTGAYWSELRSDTWWRWRGIRGGVDLTGLTGNGLRFFNELSTRVSTIQRIIDGEVDLSGLTARQLSLLDLIRGTTTGTVTLGGSFVFDPSASFTTWWESATETQITTPMSVLTDALADLRAAADANTAALEQARIDNYIAGLTVNNRGQSFMNDEQIRTVADMMGIDQSGASLGQLMWRIANASRTDALERVFYDPTGAAENRFRAGTSWDYRSGYTRDDFSIVSDPDNPWSYSITGPQGGTQTGLTYDQVYALMDGVILGDVPAFATGGSHAGGLRLVGEQGVELEATGPSRIYSARQTQALLAGAGSDVADQIARLTDELKELRKENVQLQSKIYGVTRDTAKRLEKFDKDGLPAERV